MGACFCTGRCRELGYCPVSGGGSYVGDFPPPVYPWPARRPWTDPDETWPSRLVTCKVCNGTGTGFSQICNACKGSGVIRV